MTYGVYTVSDEEYTKADLDWSYSPEEQKIGEIEAEYEQQALAKLAKGIKSGKYPKGSQIQLP